MLEHSLTIALAHAIGTRKGRRIGRIGGPCSRGAWIRLTVGRLGFNTVDSVLTHTPRWTPKVMGFHRVWDREEVVIG